MNWFVLANGILYIAAAVHSIHSSAEGHNLWALVWLCYAVSAIAMFVMEPK